MSGEERGIGHGVLDELALFETGRRMCQKRSCLGHGKAGSGGHGNVRMHTDRFRDADLASRSAQMRSVHDARRCMTSEVLPGSRVTTCTYGARLSV